MTKVSQCFVTSCGVFQTRTWPRSTKRRAIRTQAHNRQRIGRTNMLHPAYISMEKQMKLEHIGLCVDEPLSMAEWWVNNLGFRYKLKLGTDNDGVAFITD